MTPDSTALDSVQARLIASLRDPAVFGRECERVTLLETHISYVLLTGRYAYKIKKAVNLGFLDFTTLSTRRFYCEQELKLNRRLAPALYLDIVAITGSIGAPAIGGSGPALEYAVKMREFAQDALASRALARNELTAVHIDTLAAKVAAFHAAIDIVPAGGPFGAPDDVLRIALQNFTQIQPLLDDPAERIELDALGAWTEREHAARRVSFTKRQRDGFVRECHGDLHLGNIALIDGELTIFDCIEFNDRMRWIDVMSEIAFTVMDLRDRRRSDLAYRFLNAYLEITGDYAGLAVLRFYLVYRAMVRAKVACLRAAQLPRGDARAALPAEYRGYVGLAKTYAQPPRPAIVITHGFTGCGKTTLSQALLKLIGAVRIRSDVERKRLHGLNAGARSGSAIGNGLYTANATRSTYERLLALARCVAAAGAVALIDATFLRRWQRDLFRELAADLGIPFVIVAFAAKEATLRARIAQRARLGTDASEADSTVLEHQLRTQEPLAAEEQTFVVTYDADARLDHAHALDSWRSVLDRLGLSDAAAGGESLEQPQTVVPGLEAKVAFLSRPQSYPEPTARVDTVETHMSWVFLTERHAYKLKKPLRTRYVDFSTEAARHQNCTEEVRLNQRLSSNVYLGTVPLTRDAGGQLRLGPSGEVVDWLLKMRRLPTERMLDHAIRNGAVRRDDIVLVMEALCHFYRASPSVATLVAQYREEFAKGIAANRHELALPAYALPIELVEAICARQRAVLDQHATLFDERVRARRIVEGHGDLRPEHICLESPPQIIDCLEFSRALRTLDTADELAFLALECERLGAPELKRHVFDTYSALTGDAPPSILVHFYQSYRACVRAKIAIWHMNEPSPRDLPKWPALARNYLRLAREHIEQCT